MFILTPDDYNRRMEATNAELRAAIRRREIRNWALLALARTVFIGGLGFAAGLHWMLLCAVWAVLTLGNYMRVSEEQP